MATLPYGIDYSYDRPNIAQAWAQGFRFACRYYSHNTKGKNLTLAEAAVLTANKWWIVGNWEYSPDAALQGYSQGESDAKAALTQANNCGQPSYAPIYFSVDFDAQNGDLNAIGSYLDACGDVLGKSRVGVYGGYRVVDWALSAGRASWGWQTYAWSGKSISTRAHLYQYSNNHYIGSANVDYNRALKAAFGQWEIGSSATPTDPAPPVNNASLGAWDYSGIITATATDVTGLAGNLDGYTALINGVRTN